MAVRTEAEELQRERIAVERKLSAQGRAFTRWWGPDRRARGEPEPDHFVWRSLADLIPIASDQEL